MNEILSLYDDTEKLIVPFYDKCDLVYDGIVLNISSPKKIEDNIIQIIEIKNEKNKNYRKSTKGFNERNRKLF